MKHEEQQQEYKKHIPESIIIIQLNGGAASRLNLTLHYIYTNIQAIPAERSASHQRHQYHASRPPSLSIPGRHDEPPEEAAIARPLGALALGCVSEAVDASEGSVSMALMAAGMDDHDEYAKLVRRMNPPR
jgi:hypothetical protein